MIIVMVIVYVKANSKRFTKRLNFRSSKKRIDKDPGRDQRVGRFGKPDPF